MIYLILGEEIAERSGVPQYMAYNSIAVSRIPRDLVQVANFVFMFIDGKTVYYKDRMGTEYQFTDEEKVVLKLRSVLI